MEDTQFLLSEVKKFIKAEIALRRKQRRIQARIIVPKTKQQKTRKETRKELLRQYDLDEESFNELRFQQDNRCGICRKPFKKIPHVDHNHATGEVRGLLCSNCNLALGLLGDDPLTCSRASTYLLERP